MPEIIDISLKIRTGSPVYPGDPGVTLASQKTDVSWITDIRMGSHAGTHMDAPSHFFEDGLTIDEIDLERCVGPAVVIDLADLHDAKIEKGSRVLIRTGWDKRWPQEDYYEDMPVLDPETARLLVEKEVICVGIDSPTVGGEETHKTLLGAGILLIEGLANLDKLTRETYLCALPLNLEGIDGSPCRAVAIEGIKYIPD